MSSTVNENETPIKRRDENKRTALMAAAIVLQERRADDTGFVVEVAEVFFQWLER